MRAVPSVATMPTANPYIEELQRRQRRLRVAKPHTLFIACEEQVALSSSPHEQRIEGSLCLPTPAAAIDHPDVIDAVRYAIERLGVRRIAVVAHSLCEHAAEELGISAIASSSQSPLDFMTRIQARMELVGLQMQAAQDRVRAGLGALKTHLDLPNRDILAHGLVHAAEAGVYHRYDRDTDSFEVLL